MLLIATAATFLICQKYWKLCLCYFLKSKRLENLVACNRKKGQPNQTLFKSTKTTLTSFLQIHRPNKQLTLWYDVNTGQKSGRSLITRFSAQTFRLLTSSISCNLVLYTSHPKINKKKHTNDLLMTSVVVPTFTFSADSYNILVQSIRLLIRGPLNTF